MGWDSTQREEAHLVIPNGTEVRALWKWQYGIQLGSLLVMRADEEFRQGKATGPTLAGSETTSGARPWGGRGYTAPLPFEQFDPLITGEGK